GDVHDAALQIQRPHRVPGLAGRLPDGHRVLQVPAAETGVADQAVAALLDELPGQPQVLLSPGLAVQLNEGGLDDGMPVQPLPRTEERAGQVIGEPCRAVYEPGRASRPGVRDRRLEQVTRAVELV